MIRRDYMRTNRWFFLILFCGFFLAGCGSSTPSPSSVRVLPQGFVSIEDLLSQNSSIEIFFWHGDVGFILNIEDRSYNIFDTAADNSNFIVKYNGKHYINKEVLLEVLNFAENRNEILNKRYVIGEPIEIHPIGGFCQTYIFTIFSVERINEVDGIATYEIKFDITPPMRTLQVTRNHFLHVTTTDGITHANFEIVDENTIRFNILAHRTPYELTVAIPSAFFFEGHKRTISLID